MRGNAVACAWLLRSLTEDADALARRLYGEGTLSSMRDATANLAAVAVRVLLPLETSGPTSAEDAAALAAAPPELHAGALVSWFLDSMLDALSRIHKHWRRFEQFFLLLSCIAETCDVPGRVQLVEKGAIGRFVDFLLCGRSPHPELNDPAYAAALKTFESIGVKCPVSPEIRSMGEAYFSPDFAYLFRALGQLVFSSAPPSGVAGSPFALPPGCPLSNIDADMLSSRQFIHSLCSQLISGDTARLYKPLVHHVLWGATSSTWAPPAPALASEASMSSDKLSATESSSTSESSSDGGDAPQALKQATAVDFMTESRKLELSLPACGAACILQQFAAAIGNGVRDSEFDDLKPYFRLAALVVDSPCQPTEHEARVDLVMSEVRCGGESTLLSPSPSTVTISHALTTAHTCVSRRFCVSIAAALGHAQSGALLQGNRNSNGTSREAFKRPLGSPAVAGRWARGARSCVVHQVARRK
jgi:hypothetical protein